MMSASSLIWGSKDHLWDRLFCRVDKSSGWDVADAKMPTKWARADESTTMWGVMTNSMPCDGQPQGIWLDCLPSKA